MTEREKLLIQFTLFTLEILERDKEWDVDTIDDIGLGAIDFGLAKSNENQEFKIIH